MNKPIIGIVCKPGYNIEEDIWNRMDIQDEFRYLVLKNGGIGIAILPTEQTLDFLANENVELLGDYSASCYSYGSEEEAFLVLHDVIHVLATVPYFVQFVIDEYTK